jgi:PD-(D/E)XK nuclease superfamily protein
LYLEHPYSRARRNPSLGLPGRSRDDTDRLADARCGFFTIRYRIAITGWIGSSQLLAVPLTRKGKGDLAELKVACDLLERGHQIALPYGEDWDFDLILLRHGRLERVQVKHSASRNGVIPVKCRSHSLTTGKVRHTKHYTAQTIDWIAIYDRTTDRCFYIRASELGSGKSILHLRLTPARNGQSAGIRYAEDYCDV